jgi:hypothetical protein
MLGACVFVGVCAWLPVPDTEYAWDALGGCERDPLSDCEWVQVCDGSGVPDEDAVDACVRDCEGLADSEALCDRLKLLSCDSETVCVWEAV